MNDDPKLKDRPADFSMMPFFGLDLGRELGSIDSRLNRMENDIQKLDAKIDRLDAKFDAKTDRLDAKIDTVDARVDKCLVAINRMDERFKNLIIVFGGIFIALVAGILLHYMP